MLNSKNSNSSFIIFRWTCQVCKTHFMLIFQQNRLLSIHRHNTIITWEKIMTFKKKCLWASAPKGIVLTSLWQPGCRGLSAVDPWLCVVTFRWLCPFILILIVINILQIKCFVKRNIEFLREKPCITFVVHKIFSQKNKSNGKRARLIFSEKSF